MISVNLRTITFFTATAMCSAAVLSQAGAQAPATAETGPKAPDTVFLQKASLGGYAEVQLGMLAAQQGTAEEVKKFGQKMVDDHTMLNNQLKPFAEAAGVKPPMKLDSKDQDEYDKLKALSGDNFDREYLAYMVKDHHADLKEFRKEEATTTNSSLKDAVAKGEAVIQEHTTMVEKLNKQMGGPEDGV